MTLQVAAGALFDSRGRVLLAQRRQNDRNHPGLWEFPGGKQEPGESLSQTIARELAEELALPPQPRAWRALPGAVAGDPERPLTLHLLASRAVDAPKAIDHQRLSWQWPWQALKLPLAPLDRRLLRWVAAPQLLAITSPVPDSSAFAARPSASRAATHPSGLPAPRRWQLLRWPELGAADYARQVRHWIETVRPARPLLVHNRPDLSGLDGVAGVHLSAWNARGHRARPVPGDVWLSVACHDWREVEQALAIDADWLLLSPVRTTNSHPERAALGWPALASTAARLDRPLLALGGARPADLARARVARIHGVAGIAAFAAG